MAVKMGIHFEINSNNNNSNRNNSKKMDFDMGIDNYSRQGRHSLSRFVGSSSNGFTLDSRHLLQQKITEGYRNGTGDLTSLRSNGNVGNTSSIEGTNSLNSSTLQDNVSKDISKDMELLSINSRIGRASAPPQIFDNNFSQFGLRTNAATTLKAQTVMNLQKHTRPLNKQEEPPTPDPTTSIDFSSSMSSGIIPRSGSPESHPFVESETMKELSQFIWNPSSTTHCDDLSRQGDLQSRALAIFGVSQLPISEIRSICEAFGSLLYFRSEFCVSRNVIFTAYHDLRSACHASKELKNYLRGMASSNLSGGDAMKCKSELHVMFSVSLLASSERDDSALVFSNLPFGVNKEQVYQVMNSFGAILSITPQDEGVHGASYLVKFYDVQDANHCILEIQSTKPWGQTVSIKTQKRAECDRQRGQDILAFISKWRMSSSSAQRSISNNSPNTQNSPPSVSRRSSLDDKMKSSNVSTSSTQSTTPPLQFIPPAPQLVLGPDGQYSYVVLQPQAYQTTAPQYVQHAPVISSHVPSTHHHPVAPPSQHPVPQPQYVFDGQNYWLQHQHPAPREHHLPNSHMTGYHSVQQSQPVTYQVLPVYPNPAPNQIVFNDSNLPGPNGQSHNFQSNPAKVGVKENGNHESNQRNALDIEAVKQGWDTRTSLMIRNIPNK